MSDDRFYCRSGSKFFSLCLLLISSVFFFLECLGWRFSRLLFLIFLCHLYRKGVLLGAFDTGFHLFQKWFYSVTIVRSLQKCFNPENDFLAFVGGGYQTYLIPKFILAMRFSFGNTSGKRLVNAVNFIGIVSFLCDNLGVQCH